MVARGFFRSLSTGRTGAGRSARAALVTFAAFATLTLGGCAGLATLSSAVASYGDWPAGQAPGSYTFERDDGRTFEARIGRFFLAPPKPAAVRR